MTSGAQPYTSSLDHLWDELRRIDQLVRAETARWRITLGASKPEQLWGMVHVTDAEVEAYVKSEYAPPYEIPASLRTVMQPYWDRAERIADSIQANLEMDPPCVLALPDLQRCFGLSDFEKDVLLVCLLPEMDARYRRLFGYLQDDASRTRPTVELILRILQAESPECRFAFDSTSPLGRYQLLAGLDDQPHEPLPMRSVRLDDRIAAHLLGSTAPDARLAELVSDGRRLGWDALVGDGERVERLKAVAAAWRMNRDREITQLVLLQGPYGAGKRIAAEALCADIELPLLVVDTASATRAAAGWEHTVRLVYREAMLRRAGVYWSRMDLLLERDQPAHRLPYLAAAAQRFPGLTFFAGETVWEPGGDFRDAFVARVDFPTPAYAMRRTLWQCHLPHEDAFAAPAPNLTALAETLANAFQFTEGQMLDSLVTARALAARRDPLAPRLTSDDLHEACRRQSSRSLAAFATRIEPRSGLSFADLVLPAPNTRQLMELRQRIRYRSRVYSGLGFEDRLTLGRGLIAMFTGSSGTGKTMAAELLASDQGVDLYKIDLSAVISKYVGETEKNLSRLFEQAEDANAILFFDEADALFGKRGDVKEAKDRWANIEVNYLLQRVEEYAGVVILASNLRQNIDDAFLRRIHVIVEFPAPDAVARLAIWKGMFPKGTEAPPELELQDLAQRFRLPGGSIRNVVLDAAFRALAAGAQLNGRPLPVSLHDLILGVAREYQKLGKPITRGEFDTTYYGWIEHDLLRE